MATQLKSEDSQMELQQPFTENSSSDHNKSIGVLKRLRTDLSYRKRVFQSLLMTLSSLTLGVVIGQQGPSFLDLQIITNTNVEQASAFFTSASFGYMVGSFITGFIHGKVNSNFCNGIMCAGAGMAAIITPHCSSYYLMIAIRFTTNMFCGGIDTFVNAEHMLIWGSDGQSLLQLIHFTFAFGGVLTPLFTEPFLAPKDIKNSTAFRRSSTTTGPIPLNLSPTNATSDTIFTHLETNNTNNILHSWPVFFNDTNNTLSLSDNATYATHSRTTNVHFAFLISGSIAIMSSVPFFIMIFFDKKSKNKSIQKYTQQASSRKLPRPLYVFLILTLCFFYLVYCCVEDTFASFLMTFVVTEYEHVSKSKGAYITTFYWASFATGRFLSIFVSKYIIAVRLITIYTIMMVMAYSGFTICALFGQIDGLTFFAGMAGIAMSAVFPAGFSWTETELLQVTGWISSFILIGSSIGMMINPLIIGYLMQEVSNMWFCYVLLAQTFILCAVFAFLLLFNRCYLNKAFGMVREPCSFEIEVEVDPLQNGADPGHLECDKENKTTI